MECPTSPTWDKWTVPHGLCDISGIGWTHRIECVGGTGRIPYGLSHFSYMGGQVGFHSPT